MPRKRNVFDDLGFSSGEAAALAMKTALYSQIVRCARKYSQSQLTHILGESQPRVSDLLRGKMSRFSLETLVTYAEALHMRPEIRTHAPTARSAASL
jgi:predicted XRE-type DNA-binding protein